MFVEATPNSELVRKLRETEEKHKIDDNKRIKFIEKCGKKIIDEIRIADPFRTNCKEPDCLACKHSEEYSNCRKSNVGYTLQCELCKSRGKIKSYEGESARCGYQRSRVLKK